jgi:hypothetical protein
MTQRFMAVAVVALGFASAHPRCVSAQQPSLDPTRATLVGLVRDSTGAPIPDVQVVLFAQRAGTYTDANGWFALAGIAPGEYDVRFQRLGFRPLDAHWHARGGERTEVGIMLRALPHGLDTVVVSGHAPHRARGHAIVLGVVVDSTGVPLSDVRLDLLGTGESAATSADGQFLFPELAPGSYMMRARRLGFAPRTVRVDVVADSRHELAIRMNALGVLLDTVDVRAESGFGKNQSAWRDYDKRQQWRDNSTSVTLLRDDLRPLGKLPLDIAFQYTPVMALRGQATKLITTIVDTAIAPSTTITDDESSCVLINGSYPEYIPLRAFHASDLQAVEVYNASSIATPESDLTGTVAARMSSIPACAEVGASHPTYYVLWFKNAR